MHIYFSGIGGAGIGPLALIAHQAGYEVSGSDKQDSSYIHYLASHGVTNVHVGQTYEQMAEVHAQIPIDWYVYSSAVVKEQADVPEMKFCKEHGIKMSKRDGFLPDFIAEKNLKLIAIAGTHGKTTTTAMAVWLFKQLGIPISYSLGGKMSFGDMGEYREGSEYFIYEADEFDRNFLSYKPYLSLITGLDYDHADIYPTRENYNEAFHQFLGQSQHTILWNDDVERLGGLPEDDKYTFLDQNDPAIDSQVTLPGHVNRLDAWQVAQAASLILGKPISELLVHLNKFPGVGRRFEQIADNIYSDYAHTPPKVLGALQLAHEVGGDNVVVVYEGLHNTRQHFIKKELETLFAGNKKVYVVPSYLAREDPNLSLLSPADLIQLFRTDIQQYSESAALDEQLASNIKAHARAGDLVLCITAGGGGSLHEWLLKTFKS